MGSFRDRARRVLRKDWDRAGRDRDAAYAAEADALAWDEYDDELVDAPARRAVAADDTDAFDDAVDDTPRRGRPGEARRLRAGGAPRAGARPARGRRRTVLQAVRDIPDYLRLAWGLLRDGRVDTADKLLVAAAVLYVVNPFDFIPDLVPFLGQVDDLFLIVLATQRMITRAGRDVIEDHWAGRPEAVDDLNLAATLSAAAFFLPGGMKRRLLGVLGGGRRRGRGRGW